MKFVAILPFAIGAIAQSCATEGSLLCTPDLLGITTDNCCAGFECRVLQVGETVILKRIDVTPIAEVLQCLPKLSSSAGSGGPLDPVLSTVSGILNPGASSTTDSGASSATDGASTTVQEGSTGTTSAGGSASSSAGCATEGSLLCIPGLDNCCAGLECRILQLGETPILKRVDISPIAEVLQCLPILSSTTSAAQSSTTAEASTTASEEASTTAEESTTAAETTSAEPSTTENEVPIYSTAAAVHPYSTTCPYSYPPATTTYLTSYTTYCPQTTTVYYQNKPTPTTYQGYSTVTVTVYPTNAIEYPVKPTVYVTYYTTYYPITKTEVISYTTQPTVIVTYSTVQVTVHPNPSNPAQPSKEINLAPVYTYPSAPANSAPASYQPVQQISDGQIQNPAKPAASSPVQQIADGQIQSPAKPSNATSDVSPSQPQTYTGAAGKVVVSFGAFVVAAMGVVAL